MWSSVRSRRRAIEFFGQNVFGAKGGKKEGGPVLSMLGLNTGRRVWGGIDGKMRKGDRAQWKQVRSTPKSNRSCNIMRFYANGWHRSLPAGITCAEQPKQPRHAVERRWLHHTSFEPSSSKRPRTTRTVAGCGQACLLPRHAHAHHARHACCGVPGKSPGIRAGSAIRRHEAVVRRTYIGRAAVARRLTALPPATCRNPTQLHARADPQ